MACHPDFFMGRAFIFMNKYVKILRYMGARSGLNA